MAGSGAYPGPVHVHHGMPCHTRLQSVGHSWVECGRATAQEAQVLAAGGCRLGGCLHCPGILGPAARECHPGKVSHSSRGWRTSKSGSRTTSTRTSAAPGCIAPAARTGAGGAPALHSQQVGLHAAVSHPGGTPARQGPGRCGGRVWPAERPRSAVQARHGKARCEDLGAGAATGALVARTSPVQ